jgi:hypothetical protein
MDEKIKIKKLKQKNRFLTAISGISLLIAALGGAVIFAYDPSMNQGDDPGSGYDSNFRPMYTSLLHLEVMPDQSIKAIRLHIPTDAADRRWENAKNKEKVAYWINKVNKDEVCEKNPQQGNPCKPAPNEAVVYEGIGNFVFYEPQHVVVYIKNKSVKFDRDYPVWFGSRLIGNVGQHGSKAETNGSFFGAHLDDLSIENYSTQILYMQNIFKEKHWYGGHSDIDAKDRKIYSLNLNTLINMTKLDGAGGYAVPLIIDPDTGNMGGGGGPLHGK